MAYNNFYTAPQYGIPQTNPYINPQYFPNMMPQQQMQQPQQPTVQTNNTPPQMQNGGFIRVQNEAEARQYPVAPGYSVTFIDDTSSYCYTKSMGYSQFDKPKFEKYKLVKEDEATSTEKTKDATLLSEQQYNWATKEDIAPVISKMDEVAALVKSLIDSVVVEEENDV